MNPSQANQDASFPFVPILSSSADPGSPVSVSSILESYGAKRNFDLPGEVHLFLISLEADEPVIASCHELLTAKERDRAQKFLSAPAAHRFLICRAALRKIIRGFHPELPSDFEVSSGPFGKPFLDFPEQESLIRFNVSHSGDFALLGFSRDAEIGVDIEERLPLDEMLGIARRVFTDPEVEQLLSLSETERRAFFYRLWTCKEAVLKAAGTGFHRDPKSLCLSKEMEKLHRQSGQLSFDGQIIQWGTHPPGYAMSWAIRSSASPTIRWIDTLG